VAEATGREIDVAVRSLIEDADARARSILEAHRKELEEGVKLLIAKETPTVEDFPPLGALPPPEGVAERSAETTRPRSQVSRP
jgi:cell division protease FtsH